MPTTASAAALPLTRALLVATLVVAGCTRTGASASTQRTGPGGCVVREVSRAPLVIDGKREMYVEPTVVLPSGTRILLAGRPNYLFSADPAVGAAGITQDSVFGAVLNAGGRAALVPSPIDPALVAHTRAVALDGGRWAMVFAQLSSPWNPPKPDTTVRLLYGEFDGATWSALEVLPAVSGTVLAEFGSELLRRGDTLMVAFPIKGESGQPHVALFERRAGRWTTEAITGIRAAYTNLLYSGSGLVLVVVRPDPSLRLDTNSLLFYGHRPRWDVLRTVLRGGAQPVFEPRLTASPDGAVLSWWVLDNSVTPSARRARAMVGVSDSADGRVVELDADIEYFTPVLGPTRFPLWVSEHNTIDGGRELRFLGDSAGRGVVLGAVPSPFTGLFAATAIGPSDILMSGPLFHADSAHPRLVSLLIRSRVECRRSAP